MRLPRPASARITTSIREYQYARVLILFFTVECDIKCGHCKDDGTTCTDCNANSNRYFDNGDCVCVKGFYEVGDAQCKTCTATCLTCGGSISNCLSCDALIFRELVGNDCDCLAGYYDLAGTCTLCLYSCKTCSSATTCTACETSTTFRKTLAASKCLCQDGYYDDGANMDCLPCSLECETCEVNATQCLTCLAGSNRFFSKGTCICKDGWYDDTGCQPCLNTCMTCTFKAQNCLTCDPLTHRSHDAVAKNCYCGNGYFDDGVNKECQVCDYTCFTCMFLLVLKLSST
jgi:hypothetical protein